VKGSAPYRAVLTHGFVVNEKRQKISKSDGKPQTADDTVKKYGADIVRLWVASENYQSDIPLSDAIFETISNQYRSMRNSLRYQLGNLFDFDAAQHAVPVEKMTAIDRWVLVETAKLVREVTDACERNEFHRAASALAGFTTGTLSATYHNVVKDRLYTTAPDDPMRRSTQTAIDIVLRAYLKLIAPFVPFTADEAWSHLNAKSEYTDASSVHLQDWPAIDARWEDAAGLAAHAAVARIQTLAAQVNVPMERLRQDKKIGQSLEASVVVTGDAADADFTLLVAQQALLTELWIVSSVQLKPQAGATLAFAVDKAEGVRCPRSWRWVPALVEAGRFGMVSPRCREALLSKYPQL
jgi:isoleucyl-tRNA synthetase